MRDREDVHFFFYSRDGKVVGRTGKDARGETVDIPAG
jgi:hypothetical protein